MSSKILLELKEEKPNGEYYFYKSTVQYGHKLGMFQQILLHFKMFGFWINLIQFLKARIAISLKKFKKNFLSQKSMDKYYLH